MSGNDSTAGCPKCGGLAACWCQPDPIAPVHLPSLLGTQLATAFREYQRALSVPVFDLSDDDRKANEALVSRCFDECRRITQTILEG